MKLLATQQIISLEAASLVIPTTVSSHACPFQDVLNSLRKSCRSNFDQVVAQREVGCFMDVLEHEQFFKRDFSRLCGLAEPEMFDEEHLPLVNPLTLNSREFL